MTPTPTRLRDRIRGFALDTETTGFQVSAGHRLIELAVVAITSRSQAAMIGGQPFPGVERPWSSLVDPGRPIPAEATAVHGITDAEVQRAPSPGVLASGIRARISAVMPDGDLPLLVFHNAPFDIPFVQQFLADGGVEPIANPVLDTLGLARGIYGMGKNGVAILAAKLEVPLQAAHRALGDALMTAGLLGPLVDWYEEHRGINDLNELAALSQDLVRRSSAVKPWQYRPLRVETQPLPRAWTAALAQEVPGV